jgi:ribosomal protein L7Ae-like RNA K-turn-binding protein
VSFEDVFNLLGLCYRARRLVVGEEACRQAIRSGKAELVLVCHSASPNTLHRYESMCHGQNVRLCVLPDTHELGPFLGKPSAKAVAVLDKGFAEGLNHKLCDSFSGGGL